MKTALALFLAAVSVFAPLSASAQKVMRNVEMKALGVVEKSTRLATTNCVGTYVYDTYDAKTNERLAVIAMPAVCDGSWMYFGDFGQEISQIATEDVVFHLIRVGNDTFMGPMNMSPVPGSDVFVANTQPIELTIGATKFLAYPNGGFLSGRISDVTWSSKSTTKCSMSGCTQTAMTQLDGQVLFVDRAWNAPTGTAVINGDNELVGIVLGTDGGRTLVMSTQLLWDRLNRAGIAGRG